MYKILLITLSFLGLKLGCDPQKPSESAGTLLACAYGQCLYKQDLEGAILAKDNSAEAYVKKWVEKKVLARLVEKKLLGARREKAEKDAADFRSKLLTYVYLEELVNEKVKQDINEQEIQDYYQGYQENFKLKHNIWKGQLIIVPKNAPQLARLKQLMSVDSEEGLKELKEYCATHATYASLDNTVWLNWNDTVPQTLSSNILYHSLDQTRLSKKPYLKEVQDASYRYYLRIDAYKAINNIAPMELVKDQVAKVILYKRKRELDNQIREDILQQAKANNDYTIYENKN